MAHAQTDYERTDNARISLAKITAEGVELHDWPVFQAVGDSVQTTVKRLMGEA